jgi:hypothetical protein
MEGIEARRSILSKSCSKPDSRHSLCVTFCDTSMCGHYWTDAGYEPIRVHKARSQVEDIYNLRCTLRGRKLSQSGRHGAEEEESTQRAMKKLACIAADEVSLYGQEGVAYVSADPLAWWKTPAAEFPGLARIRLDVLAIPATTANVEGLFSQAKLILTDGRSV